MKKLSKTTNNKMTNFVLLLSVMLVLTVFHTKNVMAENSTRDSEIEAKIINGKESESDAWPWMAHIIISDGIGNRWGCGGTLVAPQWVLTAAHCAEDMVSAKVLLDRNDFKGKGGEIISVTHSVIHPDRDIATKYADLALMHLESPTSITPVSLANDFDFQSEEGNSALAIGWGITHQSITGDDISPTKLQQVELPLKHNQQCIFDSRIPEDVICVGIFDEKSTCRGDSGGPLLMFDSKNRRWNQIGITSFGSKNCSSVTGISVYAQVDKFKHFIDSTINSSQEPSETPEEFLAKCVKKYPDYLGEAKGAAYFCGNSEICQDTTGGRLMDIIQISVLENNKEEMLEFFDNTARKWYKISFSNIGYCE